MNCPDSGIHAADRRDAWRGRWSAFVAACALLAMTAAQAAIFDVNSVADMIDATPGDGVCETASDNHVCTLRAAVQEANALSGTDTINLQANSTYLLTRVGLDDTGFNGDLDVSDSVNIVGAGSDSTIIDANGLVTNDRVISFLFGASSVSGVWLRHGFANDFGGAIISYGTLDLTNCKVSDSAVSSSAPSAAAGGGVFTTGVLSVVNSSVLDNSVIATTSFARGGGISAELGSDVTIVNSTIAGNSAGGSFGTGGGISAESVVKMSNSTISGNTSSGNGGGIRGSMIAVNSTISGNSTDLNGGGVYTVGSARLYNVTVVFNVANTGRHSGAGGGGVYNPDGSTLTIANSILSGSSAFTDTLFAVPSDCAGSITSDGYNIVTHRLCTISGSYSTYQPLLGPLEFNGGPTKTHALRSGNTGLGNPIDGGNPLGCTDDDGAPVITDQRGLLRPIGAACDMGAYEFRDLIYKDGFDA
jgi:CSLREA domain-containing protein